MISVAEARGRILSDISVLGVENVPLRAGLGRVLAASPSTLRPHPAFDTSAMDGYAVRAQEMEPGKRLKVIGTSHAGHPFEGHVAGGESVRIFTGALMPSGTDAVLIQEQTSLEGDDVVAQAHVSAEQNVRLAGFDLKRGDVPLMAGHRLGPRDLGLLAAMGHADILVRRKPKVVLLETGDELVPPGSQPAPGQIIATNGLTIAALLETEGCDISLAEIARDDLLSLGALFESTFEQKPDLLITFGGASVGDRDFVRAGLERSGAALDFWKIAMRPGKPMMYARKGATRVLGLPGNPVSAYVCSLLFVRPLVRALQGQPLRDAPQRGILGADIAANGPREHYMRAVAHARQDGGYVLIPSARQDSSAMSELALCNALIMRTPHAEPVQTGANCDFIWL